MTKKKLEKAIQCMRITLQNSSLKIPHDVIEKMLEHAMNNTVEKDGKTFTSSCVDEVNQYDQQMSQLVNSERIELLEALAVSIALFTLDGTLPLENVVGLTYSPEEDEELKRLLR